jgi:hypothetical protein
MPPSNSAFLAVTTPEKSLSAVNSSMDGGAYACVAIESL